METTPARFKLRLTVACLINKDPSNVPMSGAKKTGGCRCPQKNDVTTTEAF